MFPVPEPGEVFLFGLAEGGHEGGRPAEDREVHQGAVPRPTNDVLGCPNGQLELVVVGVVEGEDVTVSALATAGLARQDEGRPAIAKKLGPQVFLKL